MSEILAAIDPTDWALFLSFWALVVGTVSKSSRLKLMMARRMDDWVLDGVSLAIQGTVIPVLQVLVVIATLDSLAPEMAGSLTLHPLLAFTLCFVGIDYLYYWNHRLLHTDHLWPLHMVHHSAPQMDVFTTSRNTVWTSLFIIYLWGNGAMLYFLADSTPYVMAATLTAILDLWRHSPLQPRGLAETILGSFLILPQSHAWHHSRDVYDVNYGANLNLWDKLHGTWYTADAMPADIGVETDLSLSKRLFWPFP
ncbi:MAG: sterol desaturase family protein [Myxococcota bacterium]|nr:sterol desaturase family protein [Myxococcota bacterium]